MHPTTTTGSTRLAAIVCAVSLLAAACGSGTSTDTVPSTDADGTTSTVAAETASDADGAEATTTTTGATDVADADSESVEATTTTTADSTDDDADAGSATPAASPAGCDDVAAQFTTRGSANPDLPDPEVSASCEGDSIVVVSNGVPDFTYIGTSPGEPDGREMTFTIPAEPTMADTVTDIPYIGEAAVTLSGIPIFGPTEGTGGDVDSLPGIISACGSHNGPSGFHTHKILTTTETDCWFTPEEVAAAPQLVGYAFDGFPIYTGTDQYTSSWQLTDESLFATDTWAAHTYVEGSGDLDRCNGRTDENGNYAYYTTEAFPYVLGCFAGEVELDAPGGAGGDGDRPERPEGDEGDRPEPPEGNAAAAERPAPPEGEDGDRPERPARPEGGERPEPPEGADDERPEPPAVDDA